ncbi:ABC transporter permease [Streptomyces profundus]|uniref:ABC transporter permease n=1 Tax=Streptomyces profundus TaxID=2867410 RepID=UPI001D1625A8|nr:ABC transporter permease [Streptomyces sp. MA3_2.13]UED87437.1 ABC transporter permease [Streptomyces sp. MA3_2.13]
MKDYAGTGELLRLALRLDRVRASVWIVGMVIFTVASASANNDLYDTASERATFAESVESNPALLALGGRAFDLSTTGGINAYQLIAFMGTLIGLMSILLVVRHTRLEEESGRAELAGSAVLGRKAWLASGLLLTIGVNVVIAVLTALGLIGTGLSAGGSIAYALGVAGIGVFFAFVGGLAAQLTDASRSAIGIASAVLGASYLLRAAGDAASGTDGGPMANLTWLSPIGWAEMARPWADERWWVLLVFVAGVAALVVGIGALVGRRDIGSGVLKPKLGPVSASAGLRSPLALAWRLQRGSLLGWGLGFVVVGAAFGALAEGTVSIAEDNPDIDQLLRDLGGSGDIVDVFLATIISLTAVIVGAYAVQSALRLAAEESGHRADPVLTTPVRRLAWAGSHLTVAAVGTVLMLGLAGAAAGLAHGLNSGDLGEVGSVTGAALAQVPAVWTLIGVCALLFGLLPRYTAVSWAVLLVALVIGQFGDLLKLDQMVLNLSPFSHVPDLPGGAFDATPLLLLLAVAAALTGAGLAGLRRRDMA